MPRRLDPKAVTPDIHWHPTDPEDERLCRDIKRILTNNDLTLGDLLRPLLTKERDDRDLSSPLLDEYGMRALLEPHFAEERRKRITKLSANPRHLAQ